MLRFILVLTCILRTRADYQCLCNYNIQSSVYPEPDSYSDPTGYLSEFDCKPTYNDGQDLQNWETIQFENKVVDKL